MNVRAIAIWRRERQFAADLLLGSFAHELQPLFLCDIERDGKVSLVLLSILLVISSDHQRYDQRRTEIIWSISSLGSELKGLVSRTWSAQIAFCWHGTLAVLMIRRWGSTRKRAKIFRWPGLVGSESLKEATRCWRTYWELRCLSSKEDGIYVRWETSEVDHPWRNY